MKIVYYRDNYILLQVYWVVTLNFWIVIHILVG